MADPTSWNIMMFPEDKVYHWLKGDHIQLKFDTNMSASKK